ncbi:rhomboid family protein [Thermoascus aurantiacus ATCC 26904]
MALRVNLPPATRIFLVSLLCLSFLYNVARWRQLDHTAGKQNANPIVPYLTLVPTRFIVYPWTLLTATFVEQNIFTVLLNAATLFYGGKYLERAWGSREFAKFILVVSLISNAVAVLVYLIWNAIERGSLRGYAFFSHNNECTTSCAVAADTPSSSLTPICGGIAIQASFLVAFKQLVPEHTVTILKGIVKMRVKHFPALFLLLNTIGGIVFGTDTAAVLSWLGLLTSWTYLRFYKRQPDLTGTSTGGLGIKGDASDTFAFATFFPDAIQPPITFVADRIYTTLVALKICTPFSEEDIATGNQQALARGQAGLPSFLNNGRGGSGLRAMGKREEAERRRALALKALDQRLQAAAAARAQSQPSSSSQPAQAQPQTAAATVPAGQNMLGETNYTPDHT